MPIQKQLRWWSIAAIVLFVTMWLLGPAILPFILGAGVAYLLDPVADRLERAGLSRLMSVVVISLLAILLLVAVVLVVVPILVRQATALFDAAPEMFRQAQVFITTRFPQLLPKDGTLGTALNDLGAAMKEQWGNVAQTVMTSLGGVISTIALLVIVPVVAFYLLLDWDRMVAQIDRLLPREHADTIRRLGREVDQALSGFVRGQGTVILILGTWYSIMLMVIGLPFGFFIGIMAAVLSFIPYVGALLGGVTAIGVALFSFWDEPIWIAAVIAVFVIGQVVEGNYLQPKIVGGHVGLHPVWLLLALSVFGSLFGFVGMVMAVPLAAAMGVLARFAIERYRESALYTGEVLPPDPGQPVLVELLPRGTVEEQIRAAREQAERQRAEVLRDARAMGQDHGSQG
ncbi:AI-2E family transporter [Paracoccus fistulariae]|nr:AI-2E family transporter [Paracoccus fistulariae]MDB6180170.1 AI-2E family transporter [Paracoccus fistulariae]